MTQALERTVVLLDVDRTILNTEQFVECLLATLQAQGVSPTICSELREESIQNQGNAFDIVTEVRARMDTHGHGSSSDLVKAIRSTYTVAELEQLLMAPGALDLLATLHAGSARVMYLTAGGVETQTLKFELISAITNRHDLPSFPYAIIHVDEQRKTILAKEWYSADMQSFDLAKVRSFCSATFNIDNDTFEAVERVVVIDDKEQNVADVSSLSVQGILCERAEFPDAPGARQSLAAIARSLMA